MGKKIWAILLTSCLSILLLVVFVNNKIKDYKFKQAQDLTYIEFRKKFVKEWEGAILQERGAEWKVIIHTHGSKSEKILFQAPWANKGMAYNTMSQAFTVELQERGFEEIIFTDGSDMNTWKFNLSIGNPFKDIKD